MMKSKYPNSRLLLKRCQLNSSWMDDLVEIDLTIEDHPRLQRVSEQFHLYFFKPGKEISHSDEVWITREVSGFISKGELPGLDTYDLGHGEFYAKECQVSSKVLIDEMLLAESQFRDELDEVLADTWRLSFLSSDSEIKHQIGLFLA